MLSPQSMWGVKVGLCLPRRRMAMIEARRPSTSPSASISTHFFCTSAVLRLSVFMALSSVRRRLWRGTARMSNDPELWLNYKDLRSRYMNTSVYPVEIAQKPDFPQFPTPVGSLRYRWFKAFRRFFPRLATPASASRVRPLGRDRIGHRGMGDRVRQPVAPDREVADRQRLAELQ